ncbi:MAG: hypothetical protein EOS06_30825 [Mesorhizobium sp.]|nr:dihydrodipicolinate synthase family protein [Mesorhizobium sp.]RWN94521.1 MAG: hypothetical protein EOS06_30825 [Mesorhizobium sp.]
MDKEFLEGVLDIKKILAIKESNGSISRYFQHMVLYPELQRVCGFDDQVLDQFLWGTRSWIAGASNFMPAEHVALSSACVEKEDFVLGRKLMKAMMPLIYLLENGGKYNQYLKYGASLAGIPIGGERATDRPVRCGELRIPQALRRPQGAGHRLLGALKEPQPVEDIR